HTALYELIYLLALFVVLTWMLHLKKRRPGPGTAMGVFCIWYGISRFGSDALRVNDERVLGMTGAQFMCLALVPVGIWVLVRVRKLLAVDVAAGMPVGIDAGVGAGPTGGPADRPADEVEATDPT